MLNKILLILSIGLFLVSCGERPLFDNSYSFESRAWNEDEKAVFHIEAADTITPYYFDLQLRTTTDFAFSNLWVMVEITAPDGSTSKQAVKVNIADDKGKWIGTRSGSMVNSSMRFSAQNFPLAGEYLFVLSQATNQPEIEEIVDVGIRIIAKEN